MKIVFSISMLLNATIFLAQENAQTDIDTNQVLGFKKVNIGSATFRANRTGVSIGIYKIALKNNVLYVVDKTNRVLPYIIVRYEFSYMSSKNKYKTIACTGNQLNQQIIEVARRIAKFTTADIDRVYAIKNGTTKESRIVGISLLKE